VHSFPRVVLWRRPQWYSAMRYVALLPRWVRELYCHFTYILLQWMLFRNTRVRGTWVRERYAVSSCAFSTFLPARYVSCPRATSHTRLLPAGIGRRQDIKTHNFCSHSRNASFALSYQWWNLKGATKIYALCSIICQNSFESLFDEIRSCGNLS